MGYVFSFGAGRGSSQSFFFADHCIFILSRVKLHPKANRKRLVLHSGHPWVLGLATGTWTHKTHHGPDSGVSHHLIPYSILCVTPRRGHPNGFWSRDSQNGVSKLSQVRVSGLWNFIAPHPDLRSGQGLNQSCSPQRELFNAMLHSPSARWERVDSRLLVVRSQIVSLTPGPSFAHNLGCRCPNDKCKAIFDIYASRPFQ
jgi:hypothetical protein